MNSDSAINRIRRLTSQAVIAGVNDDEVMQAIYETASDWNRSRGEIRLSVPFVPQGGIGAEHRFASSGAACAVMMRRWAEPVGARDLLVNDVGRWFEKGKRVGTGDLSVVEIVAYLKSCGTRCHPRSGATPEGIKRLVNEGVCVIALVGYTSLPARSISKIGDHYIVMTGISHEGKLLYHDPAWRDEVGSYVPIDDDRLVLAMTATNQLTKCQIIVAKEEGRGA